jgi:CubicO group peptidase (beta-lactamase class C family)
MSTLLELRIKESLLMNYPRQLLFSFVFTVMQALAACSTATSNDAANVENTAAIISVGERISQCVNDEETTQASFSALQSAPRSNGFVVIAGSAQGAQYTYQYGDLGANDAINIASASKWATAVTLLTLVDREEIELETTIGEYFPEIHTTKKSITLRQLLAHTSGIAPRLIRRDTGKGGAQSVARRMLAPNLMAPPGTSFRYGGSSMQVAGAIAEQITGKNWSALFAERVAGPLGLKTAAWGRPLRGPEVGREMLGGGLFISARDFAALIHTLSIGGGDIVSSASIDQMFSDQVGDARIDFAPNAVVTGSSYGLGSWCEGYETVGGACKFVHSAGAWGAYPWIDRTDGTWGIIFIKSRLNRVIDAERVLIKNIENCL